jgi:hypothetical protein
MKHLDEGTIQAFLDGELEQTVLVQVAAHLARCEKCELAVSEAESEIELLNTAFADDTAFVPVPSQRIWARVANEIEQYKTEQVKNVPPVSNWNGFSSWFTLTNLAMSGSLAVLLLGIGLFMAILNQTEKQQLPNDDLARQTKIEPTQLVVPVNQPEITPTTKNEIKLPEKTVEKVSTRTKPTTKPVVEKAVFTKVEPVEKPVSKTDLSKTKNQKPKTKDQRPNPSNAPLPEEKQYLDAIAGLQKAVNTNDELTMRPSFRVEYEKNLAVVDKAIEKMQTAARKNPKDENVKQVLFASYQNKIDLLNTVAEKSQMIASLR